MAALAAGRPRSGEQRCLGCGRMGTDVSVICCVGPHNCLAKLDSGVAADVPGLQAGALRAVLRPLSAGLPGLPPDFELRLARFLVGRRL